MSDDVFPMSPDLIKANQEADKARADDAKAKLDAKTASDKVAADKAKPADHQTARDQLRAFEDEHIGKDAVRNKQGHVERGFGSKFKTLDMDPSWHDRYVVLEKMVEAEDKVNAANIALSTAKAAYDSALEELARLDAQARPDKVVKPEPIVDEPKPWVHPADMPKEKVKDFN
jgi:hypothetical protein